MLRVRSISFSPSGKNDLRVGAARVDAVKAAELKEGVAKAAVPKDDATTTSNIDANDAALIAAKKNALASARRSAANVA